MVNQLPMISMLLNIPAYFSVDAAKPELSEKEYFICGGKRMWAEARLDWQYLDFTMQTEIHPTAAHQYMQQR